MLLTSVIVLLWRPIKSLPQQLESPIGLDVTSHVNPVSSSTVLCVLGVGNRVLDLRLTGSPV